MTTRELANNQGATATLEYYDEQMPHRYVLSGADWRWEFRSPAAACAWLNDTCGNMPGYPHPPHGSLLLPTPIHPMSKGELWEPCPCSGCDNEPVCLVCGLCVERHCGCDGQPPFANPADQSPYGGAE